MPDLFIPSLKLFIEMKGEKGRVGPAQRKWLNYLSSYGYQCLICYGALDAINQIGEIILKEGKKDKTNS